ncbi:hypothetical protein AB3S75_005458 [Citrus x aurantiifolia]
MAKGCSRLVFFFFFLILAVSINAQNICSNDVGNYTSNSAYKTNLNSVLSSIASNTAVDYGFYNESAGQEPDKVNVIALCRGDIATDVCRGCLENATQEIFRVCPNQKQAIIWSAECMLRYSNKTIFGVLETGPTYYMWNVNNVTDDVSLFNQALQDLLRRLRGTAASGNSQKKFATGDTTASFRTIYALEQCTPDLSELQCSDCLDRAIGEIPNCCSGKIGGRVLKPSCNFRFETERFYNPTANSPPPSPPPPAEGNGSDTARTVIIILIPIVGFVILIIFICFFLRRRKPRDNSKVKSEAAAGDEINRAESLQFDFNTIRVATDNFSEDIIFHFIFFHSRSMLINADTFIFFHSICFQTREKTTEAKL